MWSKDAGSIDEILKLHYIYIYMVTMVNMCVTIHINLRMYFMANISIYGY